MTLPQVDAALAAQQLAAQQLAAQQLAAQQLAAQQLAAQQLAAQQLATPLDPRECADALIAAGGNRSLAAERLNRLYQLPPHTIVPSSLTGAIASDAEASDMVARHLRTVMMFDAYDMLAKVALAVQGTLETIEPKDAVRAYEAITRLLTELTDNKTTTTNLNITQVAMNMLPPHVRSAVLALVQGEAPGSASANEAASSLQSSSPSLQSSSRFAGESTADRGDWAPIARSEASGE